MTSAGGAGRTVAAMLWSTAERLPEKVAVVERDRATTYGGLVEGASRTGLRLRSEGVGVGDRVVILLDRGPEAIAAYFGTVAVGAVAVVLNPVLRPRQVEYALEHSGAKALLTVGDVLVRMHRPIRTTARVLDVAEDGPGGPPLTPLPAGSGDIVQITYTSGSTGLPKGVAATHGNVWAAIETVAGYLGLEERDRIAGLLPFSGVYGANQMLCSTFVGGTLVVPTSPLMNQVALELREAEATVLAAVPPLWTQLLQAPEFAERPIPSLRILQNAGGHLPPSVGLRLREIQPQARIFLQYGMTEVFRSTYLPPEEMETRPDSMGLPMEGAEILVVRDDGTPCEPGEVGELVQSGPTVAAGYWNDEERTRQVFRPHPIRGPGVTAVYSGDLVRRDEDGYLYFVGRRDRVIKTLGYRVGPDEIVDALLASGEIVEGVVTSEDDSERGQRVVVYVVLAPGGSVEALTRFARAELPRYMQPARITALEEIPRLPNGKHDLQALKRRAGAV